MNQSVVSKAAEREHREEQRCVNFLLEASRLYRETCPELSGFFMQRPREANELSVTSHCRKCQLGKRRCRQHHNGEYWVCRYCSRWLEPGNHRVRVRPKRRASARVQSVLRREARGRRLSLAQKDMLRRFRTSCCTLMATCHTCNNTSRYSGPSRDYTSPFSRNQITPGGGGGGSSAARRQNNKTPQQAAGKATATSTPKSLRKDKTPTRTPRASTSSSSSTPASASSSSSSSSSSKVKKWVVQRLSKILVREDDQGRKKSSLKDFLCSL